MYKQKSRQATKLDIEIGFRVRKIRQDKKLSQSKVALLLNITYQQLQKYELGKNKISASRLSQIADILQVSEQELLKPDNFVQLKKLQDAQAVKLWDKIDNTSHRVLILQMMENLLGV